ILFEADGTTHGVAQIHLTCDLIVPVRRVRVLEIGHVRISPRIEGIDDHLAIDRTSNFDAPALQVGRQWADAPVARTYGRRLVEKVGALAGVEPCGAFAPR